MKVETLLWLGAAGVIGYLLARRKDATAVAAVSALTAPAVAVPMVVDEIDYTVPGWNWATPAWGWGGHGHGRGHRHGGGHGGGHGHGGHGHGRRR